MLFLNVILLVILFFVFLSCLDSHTIHGGILLGIVLAIGLLLVELIASKTDFINSKVKIVDLTIERDDINPDIDYYVLHILYEDCWSSLSGLSTKDITKKLKTSIKLDVEDILRNNPEFKNIQELKETLLK